MVKRFFTVTVNNQETDEILFTAYRSEYDNARNLWNKMRRKLEADGWNTFDKSSHYYCGDGGSYYLLDKEFECLELNLDNDMAQLQDTKDGRLVLMLGDGTNKYFDDESEVAVWMADIEHNSKICA